MGMYASLKADLSKFRKRKTNSTDGGIPGVYTPKNAPSEKSAVWHFPVDLPHHTNVYDPTHAAYDLSGPEYVLSPAWFEATNTRPIDQIRFDPIEFDRQQRQELHYEDNLMTPELMEMILAKTLGLDVSSELETIEAKVWQPPAADEISAVVEASELPSPQQMQLADMAQEMLPETPMQGNIQTLDQVVEQEFRQIETAMQQQFEQAVEDPYQQQLQMYNQQMQQMLNPFMMLGGFGPPPMM